MRKTKHPFLFCGSYISSLIVPRTLAFRCAQIALLDIITSMIRKLLLITIILYFTPFSVILHILLQWILLLLLFISAVQYLIKGLTTNNKNKTKLLVLSSVFVLATIFVGVFPMLWKDVSLKPTLNVFYCNEKNTHSKKVLGDIFTYSDGKNIMFDISSCLGPICNEEFYTCN